MIKITPDKNGKLTQWDVDRKIVVTGLDLDGAEVHFASPGDDHGAYAVTPAADGSASVPNILLTMAGTINVYVYPADYTVFAATLPVAAREKPDDYIYTETEVLSYKTLDEKIGDVDERLSNLSEEIADLPQPDWNQNDETAKDYVKNRPFYTGDPVETVLVEESTVTFEDDGSIYMASFQNTFEVTGDMVGETWKISWDGTVYECTCLDADGILVIGNLSIVGKGSDTGEPFVMGIVNVEETRIFTADTSASHTFSISATVIPVVKIDKKYLFQPDWNQNDETAADFVKNRPFYTETGNVTVKNAADVVLKRFPAFAVGDTVTVSVDGVEHSLVAYDDEGTVIIGDTYSSLENGEGQFGWQIWVDGEVVYFYATEAHTVSYLGTDYIHKIDPKYLPDEIVTDAESIVASHNTSTDSHSDIRLLISGLADRLNALADSDDTTLDQLSEVVAYIKSNRDLISSITTSKVNVSDIVNNLTTNVSNKPLSAAQGVALKALIDEMNVPASTTDDNGKVLTVVDGAPSWTITSSEQAAISAANAEQSAKIAQECAQAMAGTFDFTGYLRYKVVDAAPETYEEGVLYLVTTS